VALGAAEHDRALDRRDDQRRESLRPRASGSRCFVDRFRFACDYFALLIERLAAHEPELRLAA
jgi:hypothetical protein